MKIVKRPEAFAAVSELRTRMDEILAQLRETPVTLEKHGRPVASLVEPGKFAAMRDALDAAAQILAAFEEGGRRLKGRGELRELEKRLQRIRKAGQAWRL